MKTDNIRIKRKNSDFLLCGGLYLLLILVGIFLIGLPFLSFAPSGGGAKIFLVILGILCTGAGGTLYGLLLYRGLKPQDALVITNKGMTNHLVGGKDGVYIEWINVSSMKVFGLSKAPMLGLSLENNESYLSLLSGQHAREAQANLEVGLPVIAIAQKDIFLPIGELKNLFSRMIKGAISWETYNSSKKTGAAPETPSAPHTDPAPRVEPVRPARPTDPAPRVTPIRPVQPTEPAPRVTPVRPAQPADPAPDITHVRLVPPTESAPDVASATPVQPTEPMPSAPEPKPSNAPSAPTHTDTQEEFILLDIDVD